MNDVDTSRLGERLLAAGHLSADQLRVALHEQTMARQSLGRVLTRLGFIDERILRDALAEQFGQPVAELDRRAPSPDLLARLPAALLRRLRVFPLAGESDDETPRFACVRPLTPGEQGELAQHLPPASRPVFGIAGESEIERAIERHYGRNVAIDDLLLALEGGPRAGAGIDQPVARLIDALLAEAVQLHASDIHFEPEAGFLRIRYRIDGLLRQMRIIHARCWPALCIRLKVLAGMDIAEARAPQDGRFSQNLDGRSVDFRCASQPTLHGENLVLRILDRARGIVPLGGLGLSPECLDTLLALLAKPHGLFLVAGPTGSGKTTTLYSLLDHLNHEQVNIMTLEDPVEYPLPRLRQTSLGEAVKLDFAGGVRAILRQDPDIILIGEIRDAETARMALRAAMTGHLVFATVHANSAIGVLPRLFDLGLSPAMLAGNLIGIVAQRLVRRLCPDCVRLPVSAEGWPQAAPDGCPSCDGQGYRGRLAIMEILPVDARLDALIGDGAAFPAIRAHLDGLGLNSLRDDGLARARAGQTTLAELARVVDLGSPP